MTAISLLLFTKRVRGGGMYSAAWFSQVHCGLSSLIGLTLVGLLSGCQRSELPLASDWQVYHNPRYDFEFPYPQAWVAASPPDNQDGRIFQDPKNPAAEIRGWAGYNVRDTISPQVASPQPLKPNFKTRQGIVGELKVELGAETSSMTLVLEQDDIRYYWQGRSPQQQFDDYYRMFYYIASQYRIPPQTVPSPGGLR
jgi:hypothetical protein